jgi:uncharacterized protein YcbK (DUF882 family)
MTDGWTRRLVLGFGLLALAFVSVPAAFAGPQRALELKVLRSGESLQVTFDRDTGPDPATVAKLQHLLRDARVNEEHPMDAALYGLLVDLAAATGHEARYEVISAYRSPRTNEGLRAAGHAVAEHSQHIQGHAMDVRLLGCDLGTLRDAALQAKRGGVGYYPSSNFVHVDTGRVRTWTGQ